MKIIKNKLFFIVVFLLTIIQLCKADYYHLEKSSNVCIGELTTTAYILNDTHRKRYVRAYYDVVPKKYGANDISSNSSHAPVHNIESGKTLSLEILKPTIDGLSKKYLLNDLKIILVVECIGERKHLIKVNPADNCEFIQASGKSTQYLDYHCNDIFELSNVFKKLFD